MIDTLALKQGVDLLGLIGADTKLVKAASTRGGEWCGPCPWCGGRDRLRVQPETGLWFCRNGCSDGRWQDGIAYVQQRDGCTFAEAVTRLGQAPAAARGPRREPEPAKTEPPDSLWRAAAAGIVDVCQDKLWSSDGQRALDWLRGRGLGDDAIRSWRLGYNPADREVFGLRVQRGIVLPWFHGSHLWAVKIRRPAGDPKYVAIKASRPAIYGAGSLHGHRVIVLTEGEFDCLLIWQAARDLVGTATFGSCSKALSAEALPYLLAASKILVAYDADEPGEKGAAKLTALSQRMVRVRPPSGKDVGEFAQTGGNVRDWIGYELAKIGQGVTA